MNNVLKFTATSVTGVVLAASIVSPAFAWHPKGQIVKSVQNITSGNASDLNTANDAKTAIAAKPGDTLKYVIVVSNTGDADKNGNNDMDKTVLKDTLPAGVELVSNAATRQITEDLGLIKPGKSVTKEYIVKVTAKTDGFIENKACFTGNSTVNDNPQSGCDVANAKVTVPPAPVVTPPAPVKPVTTTPAPVTPAVAAPAAAVATTAAVTPATSATTPTELPKTGPASILMLGAVATVAGYALNVLRLKLSTKFRTN